MIGKVILAYGQGQCVKQGGIHGNPVTDGWAGAEMRKPLGIQKCFGRTDGPTDRHGKVWSRVSATKNSYEPKPRIDQQTDKAGCRVA